MSNLTDFIGGGVTLEGTATQTLEKGEAVASYNGKVFKNSNILDVSRSVISETIVASEKDIIDLGDGKYFIIYASATTMSAELTQVDEDGNIKVLDVKTSLLASLDSASCRAVLIDGIVMVFANKTNANTIYCYSVDLTGDVIANAVQEYTSGSISLAYYIKYMVQLDDASIILYSGAQDDYKIFYYNAGNFTMSALTITGLGGLDNLMKTRYGFDSINNLGFTYTLNLYTGLQNHFSWDAGTRTLDVIDSAIYFPPVDGYSSAHVVHHAYYHNGFVYATIEPNQDFGATEQLWFVVCELTSGASATLTLLYSNRLAAISSAYGYVIQEVNNNLIFGIKAGGDYYGRYGAITEWFSYKRIENTSELNEIKQFQMPFSFGYSRENDVTLLGTDECLIQASIEDGVIDSSFSLKTCNYSLLADFTGYTTTSTAVGETAKVGAINQTTKIQKRIKLINMNGGTANNLIFPIFNFNMAKLKITSAYSTATAVQIVITNDAIRIAESSDTDTAYTIEEEY